MTARRKDEEAIGQTPRLFKSGRRTPDFYRSMWETLHRTGGWQAKSGTVARMARCIPGNAPTTSMRKSRRW